MLALQVSLFCIFMFILLHWLELWAYIHISLYTVCFVLYSTVLYCTVLYVACCRTEMHPAWSSFIYASFSSS